MALVRGSNLKRRFEAIRTKKLLLSAVLASVATSVIVLNAPPMRAQDVPDWQTAAGGKMAFEVASVKPAKPSDFVLPTFWLNDSDAKPPGGRFRASYPLIAYILFAYKLGVVEMKTMSDQLPKWASAPYVIEARADANPTKDQMRLMMQSLLADRFNLRVHFETRQGPVYALTLVEPPKPGPKLLPHSEGPACPDSFEMPKPLTETLKQPPIALPKPGVDWPPQCEGRAIVRGTSDATWIGARNTPPWLIARDIYSYGSLLRELDKPIVDRTGLRGMFDWVVELPAGMISLIPKPPSLDDPPGEPKGTPFLDAVHKQLGLKLERSRGEVRTLIIDHVERPSAD
jgi:uncharacterized protein (TIGR03435 family)